MLNQIGSYILNTSPTGTLAEIAPLAQPEGAPRQKGVAKRLSRSTMELITQFTPDDKTGMAELGSCAQPARRHKLLTLVQDGRRWSTNDEDLPRTGVAKWVLTLNNGAELY